MVLKPNIADNFCWAPDRQGHLSSKKLKKTKGGVSDRFEINEGGVLVKT